MKKDFKQVYQFKITLKDSKPPVWRRIQVPETYSFWDLHVAIQDSMGWDDTHLHEFEIMQLSSKIKARFGIPDEDFSWDIVKILPGWEYKIADYFSLENKKADYTYDFGDDWEHIITLEKILPRDKDLNYPRCIQGERACPPEDCGGVWEYEEICRGKSEFQKYYRDFNSEEFDVNKVHFDNPEKRWKIAFGHK